MSHIRLLAVNCRPIYKRSLSYFYTTSSFPSARISKPACNRVSSHSDVYIKSSIFVQTQKFSSSAATKRKWQWTSPAKAWSHDRRLQRRRILSVVLVIALGFTAYYFVPPFRYFVIAVDRCGRVGIVVALNIIDYKILFARTGLQVEDEDNEQGRAAREKRHNLYSECHGRCAKRVLGVLLINGVCIPT